MKKIKILWIITNGIKKNGICVSQLDYYRKMNKNKFEIDVVAVHNNTEEMIKKYKEAGCKVYILPDRQKKLLKYIKELKKIIQRNQYDIIHVHGSSSLMFIELLIAKKNGVKIRIAHSRNTQTDHPIIDKIFRRKFLKLCNYKLACGKDAGKWLYNNGKFEVMHVGKDLEKYKFNKEAREKIRNRLNIKDDTIAFGHVGLFDEQKNHKFLIKTFYEYYKINKKSMLFLIGFGPLKDEIIDMVKKLKLENAVVFLGTIDNVDEIICGLDCMLFPSLFEGLPNVVIEWQASGINSIISKNITDECAITNFCKRISIDDGINLWTNEMKKIGILDDEDRARQSEQGCKALKENGFEINLNTKKLEKYYISCMEEQNANKKNN